MSKPRDFFEEGFIRLSQRSALNDPFEAAFCQKSLDELVEYFDESKSWDPEFGELSYSEYVKLRMNNIGVLSFSENKENLLMWAHYANEHKGVVAGITCLEGVSIFENLFTEITCISTYWMGDEWSSFNGIPKPVSYRKGMRYRNDKFDYDYSNICIEGADRILHEIFLQKSDEWIYEQEHRVILRLEQADRVSIPSLNLIKNKKIIKKLKQSQFVLFDSKGFTVDLYKVEDKFERLSLATQLAKLSPNPEVFYFMKLSSSAINNCLLGLNCSLSKSEVGGKHAKRTGRFEVWKAKKNLDYYSIEFDEL